MWKGRLTVFTDSFCAKECLSFALWCILWDVTSECKCDFACGPGCYRHSLSKGSSGQGEI